MSTVSGDAKKDEFRERKKKKEGNIAFEVNLSISRHNSYCLTNDPEIQELIENLMNNELYLNNSI